MPKGFTTGLRGGTEAITGDPNKKMVVAAILDAMKEAKGGNKLRERERKRAILFLRNKNGNLEELLGFLDVDVDACLRKLKKYSEPYFTRHFTSGTCDEDQDVV